MFVSPTQWKAAIVKRILRRYVITVVILAHIYAGIVIAYFLLFLPSNGEPDAHAMAAIAVGRYLMEEYPQREGNFRGITQWMNRLHANHKERLTQDLVERILGQPDAKEGADGNVTLWYHSTDSNSRLRVDFSGGLLVSTSEITHPENQEP